MRVATGIGGLATAVVAVLLLAPDDPARLGNLGFVAILAVPCALAVASLARRPVLLIPAALLSIGLSPMLWSGMPLLLIPGLAYAWAYGRRPRPSPGLGIAGLAAVLAPVSITILAVRLLTSETIERCTTGPNYTACTSVPPPARTAWSVALAFLAVIAGCILATPRHFENGAQLGPFTRLRRRWSTARRRVRFGRG